MVTIWNYYNAISCEQSTWSRILEAINLSLSEVITWKKSKKRNQTSQRSSGRHPSPAGRSIAGWSRRQICRTGKRESHAGSRNCSPARSSQPETQQRSAETDEDAVPACNHQKRAGWYGQTEKSVRGLVVVHPMTALGREMGLQEMTGFSKTAF